QPGAHSVVPNRFFEIPKCDVQSRLPKMEAYPNALCGLTHSHAENRSPLGRRMGGFGELGFTHHQGFMAAQLDCAGRIRLVVVKHGALTVTGPAVDALTPPIIQLI